MFSSRLLRQFIAVAEELHFGRAADRIGIAQSPLSQAIRKLEQAVGATLFLRNKRSVSLTPAGEVFLAEAYQWLRFERVAVQRARLASSGEGGQLSVGFIGSTGYGFMPELIRCFLDSHAKVRINLIESTTKDQLELLENRSLDVGLVTTPLPRPAPSLDTWLYRHDALMVALPDTHRFANRRSIRLEALAGEPFAAFSRERVPSRHAQLLAACTEAGFYPDIQQECSQVGSIVGLVATGYWIALVPENLIGLKHPKVRYVALAGRRPSHRQEISLAWRKQDRSPVLASFLQVAGMNRPAQSAPHPGSDRRSG